MKYPYKKSYTIKPFNTSLYFSHEIFFILELNDGIGKVNVATELKIAFSDALKQYFIKNTNANDPRYYMKPAKAAMKEVVKKIIDTCGCAGKL